MKFTTLVDYIYIYIYIYMCVQSRMHFRVMNVFFLKCIFFSNHFILDLVKAKPIGYCIELPI